jgi:hypothetical protein
MGDFITSSMIISMKSCGQGSQAQRLLAASRQQIVLDGIQPGGIPLIQNPKDYYRLNRDQKNSLKAPSTHHLADPPDCHENTEKVTLAPAQEPEYVRTLLTQNLALAQRLHQQYPEARYHFASFGRTPLLALECMTAMKGGRSDYTLLSGSSFKRILRELTQGQILGHLKDLMNDDDKGFQQWTSETDPQNPSAALSFTSPQRGKLRANLLAYKRYATQKGMDPASIVKKHAQSGQKTVMLDGVSGGESILMLAHMLQTWAQEQGCQAELKQAMQFHLILPWGVSPDISRHIGQVQAMGFQVVLDEDNRNNQILALKQALYTNGWGMGIRLPLGRVTEFPDAFVEEVLANESAQASMARFGLYDYLHNQNLLKAPETPQAASASLLWSPVELIKPV